MNFSCNKKENSSIEVPTKTVESSIPTFKNKDYTKAINWAPLPIDSIIQKKSFIEKFYLKYWKNNQVSGGLLVAKNGKIIYERYAGYANKQIGDTLTANAPLHIASISKVLTATVILKLVENGDLKLDQLVYNFYRAFPYRKITIRDLLSHRSGLPNYSYFKEDPIFWNTNKILSNENVLEMLIQKKALPDAKPNKKFIYSNTNFALLALIIEEVTGLKYPEAMDKILFEPLGMSHTSVFNIKDSLSASQSYTYKGKHWEFNYLDGIYGDKNIYSTPEDLFKFDCALYDPAFLSKDLLKQMKKGYSYEKEGVKNYGLGIRMMEWETGEKLLYHNGWWHGNYATYVRSEVDSATVIALGNQQIRTVFDAFNLISIFGNYPIPLMEVEEDAIIIKPIIPIPLDSLD